MAESLALSSPPWICCDAKVYNVTVRGVVHNFNFHLPHRCRMGGLKVHPTEPAAWYEFEMLNAHDNTLFMHYQVMRARCMV